LQPGESKPITLRVKQSELAIWNVNHEWKVEPGKYTATVGGSSSGGSSANFNLESWTPSQ
jgi:hypothetical protein